MSETIVQNVDPNALVDIFNINPAEKSGGTKFGMENVDINLFPDTPKNDPPNDDPSKNDPAEQPADANSKPEGDDNPEGDIDILGQDNPKPEGSQIADLASYYQDRLKSGKFIAVEDVDDKGNPVPFIPKTPEEYDEVLDLQVNYRLEEARKDLDKKWYGSKSPAWQAVARYAELVDDPSQLLPFIQGVKTFTTVSNLDENDPEGAEQIVRTRLSQKGDPEDIIAQQIDALKTTDKLISTAKAYKPVILQQEQQQLHQELHNRQEDEKKYRILLSDIRDGAINSIESPIFGKTKLRQEEKASIYDLIGEPSEETQGYAIYNVIDSLFDNRDFEKLKEVALLLSNREAFMKYLGTNVANTTAASLERKLRLAGESRKSSGNDFYEDTSVPRVPRNQFKTKPTFGR